MMQECPKCGFLQPQDRFCANCGLDIENYRPTPTPWHRKLVFNTTLQISAIVASIVAMVAYISIQQSQKIETTTPQFIAGDETDRTQEGSSQKSESELKGNEAPKERGDQGNLPQATSPSAKMGGPPGTPDSAGNKALSTGGTAEQAPDSPAKVPTPSQLVVRFAELPREMLSQIFAEAQILHEGAQVQVGTYKFQEPIEQLIKKNPQARFLPGQGKGPLTGGSVRVQYTKPLGENPEELQGLNFEVMVMSFTPTGLELETAGGFFLSAKGDDPTVNVPLEGSYTLNYGSVLIIAGIVPHRPFTEKEASAFRGSPIEIMSSPEFLANESELVLILKAQ